MRFSLAELARRRGVRRRLIVMRPIEPSRAVEAEVTRAMMTIVAGAAAEVRQTVMPAYRAEWELDGLTTDGPGGARRLSSILAALEAVTARLTAAAAEVAGRIFEAEGDRHTEKWLASIRSAIGVDMRAVLAPSDVAEAVATANARNAGLIKSLGAEVVKRIEAAVYGALAEGATAKQLAGALTEQLGVTKSRARLIARDQTSKLTADLNRHRQEQAGVTSYDYSTSRDERVRSLHRQHDGKRFRWDGNPKPSDGPPGTAVNCRCVALAVIEIGDE